MLWRDILYLVIGIIVGGIIGFLVARKYMKKYIKDKPPVKEKIFRAMMMKMGRTPSQKH